MIFWSESAPLALAVTSRPVGAHSDDKLAEGGGRGGKGGVKERRKKGGTEGGSESTPFAKSRDPHLAGREKQQFMNHQKF